MSIGSGKTKHPNWKHMPQRSDAKAFMRENLRTINLQVSVNHWFKNSPAGHHIYKDKRQEKGCDLAN